MRDIFSKSKATFAIILVSLFVLTSLQSCDKAKQFEGTTWKSSSFKTSENVLIDPLDEEWVTVNYTIIVTISFNKDDADISAEASFINPSTNLPDKSLVKGTAKWTYNKKDMSVNARWNTSSVYNLDKGNWTGTADKTTMTLKDVFGETVKFTKQ